MSKQTQNPKLQIPNKYKTVNTKKVLVLLLIIILIPLLVFNIFPVLNNISKKVVADILNTAAVEPVSAQEIYSMFICPCSCGQSLQCVCGYAKERKAFIDGLTSGGLSKDDVLTAYVKKYGLNSFVDKNLAEEFKQKLAAQAPANRPIISLTPETIDLGDVSQNQGTVNTLFEITNTGKSDLVINKLETSCGCTSASVVYQGKEGPKFSMNMGQKPPKWQVSIPPGQTAQLKVYYDPKFHQNLKGYVIREISVFSNDPIDTKKTVQIELNQIK